jgi:hypothetical protein
MIPIGARIEVPRQDDLKGWGRLHNHVLSCSEEIEHYRDCALRDRRVGRTKCKRDREEKTGEKSRIMARVRGNGSMRHPTRIAMRKSSFIVTLMTPSLLISPLRILWAFLPA